MNDLYLIPNTTVLKNLLGITDEAALDLAEAELSRANMMLLYEKGFDDFSVAGICKIHKALFGDVYEWAGQFRKINISKREEILFGRSVWYSNCTDIERDLSCAWSDINAVKWEKLTRDEFVNNLTHLFPPLWKVHPFREGNTRTIVMLMTFFVEHYGYYFDQELMATSAGYVRDSLVYCCIDDNSEFKYLHAILNDAILTEPIEYDGNGKAIIGDINRHKYEKYKSDYKPTKHEYKE